LLRVHDEAAEFLATAAGGAQGAAITGEILAATIRVAPGPSEDVGDRIGRYKLLQ
jgi:hypothetical protein